MSSDSKTLHYIVHNGGPLPLVWNGWRSDTHELRRRGWQLMASENYNYEYDCHEVRIGAKCPDNQILITGRFSIGRHQIHQRSMAERYTGYGDTILEQIFHSGFPMQVFKSQDRIYEYTAGHPDFTTLHMLAPIDVYEQTATSMGSLRPYSQLRCFKYVESEPTKEIYIPSNSVDECLDRILQLQYPQQKGLVLPEKQPIIQAKIFSLAA